MNYAIVLAGGSGTRFWPLSRQSEPKQFLNICSDKSLLVQTFQRIYPLIRKENIFIAANKMHKPRLEEIIRNSKIPLKNIFFEPKAKNTLAPIAVISKILCDSDRSAVIAVLPSDHFIKDGKKFVKGLKEGLESAKKGNIATLGILPTRPETGYGYIKVEAKTKSGQLHYRVEKFMEKPDFLKAKQFIKDSRYYWNAGIFIFRPDIILGEIRKLMPKTYAVILQIKNKQDLTRLWAKLPAISFDYAVMEQTKKAVVLPVDCGWSDCGSWQAIAELLKKDKQGNIFRGKCLDLGSKNSFVWSDNRLVATLGLDDTIVINTRDALLVCPKQRAQDVKKIVQIFKQNKYKKYL